MEEEKIEKISWYRVWIRLTRWLSKVQILINTKGKHHICIWDDNIYYLNEGRLEEGRRPSLIDQKNREKPRITAFEDVVSQALEVRKEELQPSKRQERRHRFLTHDRKEQVQRKTTLTSHLKRRSKSKNRWDTACSVCQKTTYLQKRRTRWINWLNLLRQPTNQGSWTKV